MLTFYKPWFNNVEELKLPFQTYRRALMEFMWNDEFPRSILLKLLQYKLNIGSNVDLNEATDIAAPTDHGNEGDNNVQNHMGNDIDGIVTPDLDMTPDMTDLLENDLLELDLGCDGHDWSVDKNLLLMGSLNEYAENFYRGLNDRNDDEEGFDLHEEDVHKPENCKGMAQRMLIFIHLYVHYQWFENGNMYPKSHLIKIQGKPGTGKTFVIHTLRNITRNLFKSNKYDEASAPTGCAASLINGKTHFRSLRIPVSKKKFNDTTTNVVINNAQESKHWHDFWKLIFVFIMDEDSMSGRPFWGWFKHRLEEARSSVDDNNRNMEHHSDILNFNYEIFQRSWGGIPVIYSFGDCHQLPPVTMKPISDMSTRPRINTSDFQFFWHLATF